MVDMSTHIILRTEWSTDIGETGMGQAETKPTSQLDDISENFGQLVDNWWKLIETHTTRYWLRHKARQAAYSNHFLNEPQSCRNHRSAVKIASFAQGESWAPG